MNRFKRMGLVGIITLGAMGFLYSLVQAQHESQKARWHREALERRHYDKRYSRLMQLADTNKDKSFGYVSFAEQAHAWKRMYPEEIYVESEGAKQFWKPRLGTLEKAIKSYETERAPETPTLQDNGN
ncbi:hypothetical protein GOV06_03860 [Candidatus Woesearchaeota archaeon]|nr:hypothetical protein [Candidatus Woesearchaeota archaeon]